MSEEKKVSSAVLGVMDSVAKLNPEEKAQLGLEIIKNLTVMELSKWVKTLEEEFGVSAAPVAVAGAVAAAPGAAAGAAPVEEKTEFQVVLANSGTNKIQVIKEVRALTNLGLKEAKDLVDGAPKVVKESVSKKEAEEIKAKLEAVGAKVEIK
jgi:large subunit ribosomal protein L7/L12